MLKFGFWFMWVHMCVCMYEFFYARAVDVASDGLFLGFIFEITQESSVEYMECKMKINYNK